MSPTDSPSQSSPLLTLSGIGKSYAAPVLEGIELQLRAGQVLALTGENGAGKSTLSKIVCGLVEASAGRMSLDGQPYAPGSRTEAEALGIRMVMQELNLIPTLSIAENLFLEKLPQRFGWIDRKKLAAAAQVQMAVVGLGELDPWTPVGELGLGHQQMVEIARNLIGSCRCLVLDEPTAMLTSREVALLFSRIEKLRAEGVAIIYISHRLEELKRIADRIVVLRDGRLVCDEDITRHSTEQLVQMMAGELTKVDLDAEHRRIGAPLLKVRGLGRSGAVQPASFDLHSGEILGVAGLIGSGRTELLRLIFGADRADSGEVFIGDAARAADLRSPRHAVRAGIAMVTEDRKGQGLLLPQSISVNTSLADLGRVSRAGVLDHDAEDSAARDFVGKLRIRSSHVGQAAGELSGGNQQKVVIARWLYRDCPVMLFDEPTRGIDIGAKADIYKLFAELSGQGKGLLVVSSDLRELMQICDRIAVMSAGRIVETFARADWSQERILAAAFSGYVGRQEAGAAEPADNIV
ncbi:MULTISPECIES: sugar ABC transporter ATP-binding protein [unclassified Herbaspirillum]|uniref:sugar ABC transporter ATP-binding protein n=1 Tax=unclassified Herbaspirillum TaxID=2624150 RepID=UPI001151B81C|nr:MULTISPECIES: sugar ABC transporter ATP-binding protein [unclassified Herbaspirillum]MBB5393322.1 ribose transport system ATP-binding protein [Herbaspirillum sp. SJZ102]TQK03929.1 monosaccharide ABC transporter ATP-binding protein (CUT2 family) [Herbaspirillum sp. SJZ130]TQK08661.1 monosaccharide ABC transporter ATP-binding protein (CUT2 family) [Herbaspirillum sp. SJZ106]TWC71932.1 monosaccharide ABC transporter ATP-binding protein (CUT2 family) [Herbaspirillum sp. SJZ099]